MLTYNIRFNKLRFLPNVTGNYTIFQQKDKQYVSGYIQRPTTDEVNKYQLPVFHRCNPEGLNCEYFQSWTLTDLCTLLKDKNQIWSKWYGAFDPPILCPINQYTYVFRNSTGEVNIFLKWYPDVLNYQWKITQKLYSGDFYIGSYYNPMLTYVVRIVKITSYPNITWNYSVDTYKGKYYVNGNTSITTDKLIDKVVGVFERCAPEGINCEYFQSWTLTDICPKLLDKNQIWSSWYGRSFDPPVVCPINKIHYQIRNGTFDLDPIIKIYTDATNYYWKLTQKMYAGNTLVGSYKIETVFLGLSRIDDEGGVVSTDPSGLAYSPERSRL
ncbi:Hypothetical protein CINCED_3A019365 [Cinara cedri]|nr:Hypothetical protein CINCED_3A019365 [Cinara cedri]